MKSTKLYMAQKGGSDKSMCLVAANSPEEAFGIMVKSEDYLKYIFNVEDFEEILLAEYYGEPCLITYM